MASMRQIGQMVTFATLLGVATGPAFAGLADRCGELDNAYGPFDYSNPAVRAKHFPIVQMAHFTPEVENLIHGRSGSLGSDLDYTLRAFPNNPRALYAMARYQMLKGGKGKARYSAECYFERAMRFKPDDGSVRMVYGIYLHRLGKLDQALKQYKEALRLLPESGEAHYDIGLLYVDLHKYALARKHAKRAYELGYPLPGLRDRLKEAGQWKLEKGQ